MLLDEQSCAMLTKGKIQVQNKLLNLNVIQIFTSFAEFTDQLLREGTRSVSQRFKAELKAYVDGLPPNEPVFTGYVLTFDVKITNQSKELLARPFAETHQAFIFDENQQNAIDQTFPLQLTEGPVDFPVERKLHRFLDRVGPKKYSLAVFSSLGEIVRGQAAQSVAVLRGEFEREEREDEDAEIRRMNLSEDEDEEGED